MNRDILRLYVVSDRRWLGQDSLIRQLEEILKSGATCLQLREKNMDDQALLSQAMQVKKLTKRAGIPLIINDRIDICKQSGADGVHLGQQDADIKTARRLLGADKLIGASARTPQQAQQAEINGADYIGAGAVFGTGTKQNAVPLSLSMLQAITRAVCIPVVAIGGIYPDKIPCLAQTGVAGVAVVSAVFAAADVASETRDLYRLVQQWIVPNEMAIT